MKSKNHNQYLVDLVLYSLLLIATPFIMLQHYLQTTVSYISHWSVQVFNYQIPVLAAVFMVLITVLIMINARKLNYKNISGIFLIFISVAAGHRFSDFYLGFSWFDLQQNWHYFAYGIYAFICYRFLKENNTGDTRIIRLTVISALLLSAFDETFQAFMSNRVFDISDIAKDTLGAVSGLIFIYLVLNNGQIITEKKQSAWLTLHTDSQPLANLLWIYMSAMAFVYFSSLLTAAENLPQAVLISLIMCILSYILVCKLHLKKFRLIAVGVLFMLITIYGILLVTSRQPFLHSPFNGIAFYRNMPVVYFDFAVFPDGSFRLTDRKKIFNSKDIQALTDKEPDIVIVARGWHGRGGEGFPEKSEIQFIVNPKTNLPVQIIILKNHEAIAVFNRLKYLHKKVTLIWHNTD